MSLDFAFNKLLDRIEALETDIIHLNTKMSVLDDLEQTEITTQKVGNLKTLVDTGISVYDAMKIVGLDTVDLVNPVKSISEDIAAMLEALDIEDILPVKGYDNAKEDGEETDKT